MKALFQPVGTGVCPCRLKSDFLSVICSFSKITQIMMAQAADEVISVRPDFRSGLWTGLSWPVLFKSFHFIPNASTLPLVTSTAELLREARERLGVSDGKSLVAYFGLLYPPRGVDQLFAMADPS